MYQKLGSSLEQKTSNTPIHRARFTQKCSGLFQEDSLTGHFFILSRATAAPTVLCCSLAYGTARTGWGATFLKWEQLEWSRTSQRVEDRYTVYRWHSVQRRPKEAIAATSVLREAMRHPKLHFQNLLSPTAFGGLWEHSIGLSSCLWSLISFSSYSQIKWVSRSKGFKLIPPNKNKKSTRSTKTFYLGL